MSFTGTVRQWAHPSCQVMKMRVVSLRPFWIRGSMQSCGAPGQFVTVTRLIAIQNTNVVHVGHVRRELATGRHGLAAMGHFAVPARAKTLMTLVFGVCFCFSTNQVDLQQGRTTHRPRFFRERRRCGQRCAAVFQHGLWNGSLLGSA
jgi:hypothetical protein